MRKLLRVIFTVLVFLTPVLNACAQTIYVEIDDAVNLALAYNLDLQSKRKELGIAEQNVNIAKHFKNPQFQSNFLIGKVREGNASQFGLLFPIEILKRGAKKRIAQTDLKAAQEKIGEYEHELKINVMEAYFSVLYLKSVVKIMDERQSLFKEMTEIAQAKPKSEVNYTIDLLHSEINYKKQIIETNKAEAELIAAQYNLNRVMNIPISDDMFDTMETSLFSDELTIMDIQLPPYDTIEKVALKCSYSIRITDTNIKKAEQEAILARNMVIPDFYVGGGYAYQAKYRGAGDNFPGAYVSAFFDVPLFYFYKPERMQAKIILEKAKTDKQSFENKLKIVLKEEYSNFIYAKKNMDYYRQILSASDEILKMSTQKYRKGEIPLVNLIITENSHQELLKEYITAMEVYYGSYLNLMRNTGHDMLLVEDIFE